MKSVTLRDVGEPLLVPTRVLCNRHGAASAANAFSELEEHNTAEKKKARRASLLEEV